MPARRECLRARRPQRRGRGCSQHPQACQAAYQIYSTRSGPRAQDLFLLQRAVSPSLSYAPLPGMLQAPGKPVPCKGRRRAQGQSRGDAAPCPPLPRVPAGGRGRSCQQGQTRRHASDAWFGRTRTAFVAHLRPPWTNMWSGPSEPGAWLRAGQRSYPSSAGGTPVLHAFRLPNRTTGLRYPGRNLGFFAPRLDKVYSSGAHRSQSVSGIRRCGWAIRRQESPGVVKGVCPGCVRKPVIATIVQKSKPSRPAYGHTISLVKSTDFVQGFVEPFSDTCLANHRLQS